MKMIYKTWDRFDKSFRREIIKRAEEVLKQVEDQLV